MEQKAGFLDRVFNSTISLPQQLMWRIWRSLEDDKIDLFSEEGIMDGALLPGVGIFDSHEHDVMPDYMAQQMGMGDGLVGELGAAILSDPLTYLTGGLSAAGKVGKAVAVSAKKAPTVGKVLREVAKKADGTLDELLHDMPLSEYNKHLDTAISTLRAGAMTKNTKAELKTLVGTKKALNQNMGRAAKDLGTDPTVHNAMQMTKDRQLALGIPGLATFGAKYNVLDDYQSWWGAFKGGVTGAGDGIAKAALTNNVVDAVPGVRNGLRNIAAPFRHTAAGWKVGGEAVVSFSEASQQMTREEFAKLGHWTNEDEGAAVVVPQLLGLDKRTKGGGKAFILKKYRENINAGLSHGDAFKKAMRSGGIGKHNESAAALWGRMTGRGADNQSFPKWGNVSKGANAIESTLDNAVTKWKETTDLAADGKFNIHPEDTPLGRVAKIFKTEREEQGPILSLISETAYNSASKFKKVLNNAFKTGSDSQFGDKAYSDFLAHTARDNDQLEALTQGLMERITKIVGEEGHSLTRKNLESIMSGMMQIGILPGELKATFQSAKINPENTVAASRALSNYMLRHRRVMSTMEKLFKGSGIKDERVREQLVRTFDDQVFPFLERETDVAGGQRLQGTFSKVNEPVTRRVETYTPEQLKRMRRTNNKYVVRGGTVEEGAASPQLSGAAASDPMKEVAEPKRILSEYEGRTAASLSDAELDDAIRQIDGQGMRDMTERELSSAANEIEPVVQFAKREGISIDEARNVILRHGKGTTRTAKATETVQPQLWDEARTSWTAKQSDNMLSEYGLAIEKAEDGTLSIVPIGVTEGTMSRSYKWGRGKRTGYRTIRDAMADARSFLNDQSKYVKKYGPKAKDVTVTRHIPVGSVDDVKKLLSSDELSTLQGKGKVYDERIVPESLHADQDRLSKLRARRQLPPEHSLHEPGQILPEITEEVVDPGAARSSEDLTMSLVEGGHSLSESELGKFAPEYSRGRILVDEVQRAMKRAEDLGVALEIDPQLMADIERHASTTGSLINDLILDTLPESMRGLWDDVRRIQSAQFEAAKAAGVWIPGSPVAYLGRYFNKSARERMASVIGDIEQTDAHLLTRLGVKQAQRFGRTMDSYSIDDLNEIYAELRRVSAKEGADERWASYAARIEHEMKEAGVSIQNLPGAKLPYDSDRIVTDPFLSLMQRLGASNQDGTIENYFHGILSSSKTKPGESLMVGGKVVGIIDNTGKTQTIKSAVRYPLETTSRKGGTETVELSQKASDLEATPQSFIIETAEGNRHVIPNAMLDETGFGLLSLGEVGEAAALGYEPTIGKSFAKASLRSDLHESIFKEGLRGNQANDILGHHVVFGAQNVMTSSIKAAAKVHQVTPQWLRTFDSVNYLIKSFQTIFRLPFHVANLSSGVFQTMLAGASPKNTMAAYMDTVRFMAGDQGKLSEATGMLGDMLGTDETVTNGVVRLLKGEKSAILKQANVWGNGELGKHLDALDDAGIDRVEALIIKHADGTETDIGELIRLAGEMELYGTFSGSLSRGSRTVAENLVRVKYLAMEPTLGGRITSFGKKTIEKMRNVSETSEVFNRTATVIALTREGHPMRRAIEIAKEAHVPYEKLTPFEKNGLKRLSVYYTFPRHYMPWAWSKFAENPTALSKLAHTIRDQNVMATQEGRPTLVLGDMRLDVGRLNANMEAAGMLAAFADRVVMPAAELAPGIDSVDPRDLVKAQSDAGLTTVGGVAGLVGQNLLPQGDRTDHKGPDFWGDAVSMVWPVKIAAMLAGKLPTQEEQSPFVDYTPLESWLTDPVGGLGLRKVRPEHELQQAMTAYRKQVKSLQLRAAATKDPNKQQRYMGHIRVLSQSLAQISADSKEKK